MANTVFKYHHQQPHHQQQHQYQQHHPQHNYPPHHGHGSGSGSNSSNSSSGIATIDGNNHNQNNSNQNSIFVLNAETKISPNSCRKFYLDFNDNPVDSSATLSQQSNAAGGGNGVNGGNPASSTSSSAAGTSVWSSASSTMCSPAAHAIQKLFNCSSGSTSKHYGNYSAGIDSKSSFKTPKSELLKKKSKFWQYLEGETSTSTSATASTTTTTGATSTAGYEGIDTSNKKGKGKSRKHKSKYWSKSNANDNQNSHNDLSELLEYSCSLCDNCRCMDCQIGYFDCDNSDDSNSEYSFHMNAYEEDDDFERGMELKATITAAAAATTSTPSTPSYEGGDGGGGGGPSDEAHQQNSLHTLGCNKIDNKNTIQQLEFENSSRRGGNHAMSKHELEFECCHQCYGLEVEQHCLDFHQLYNGECGGGGGGGHRNH